MAGAGNIGCYIGGCLALGGEDVRFLARQRVIEAVGRSGLHLTDLFGLEEQIEDPGMTDDPGILADADIVLVTVKSSATKEMAHLIQANAPDHSKVISLQNGVCNVGILRELLPDRDVRAGMVPFNVVPTGPAAFHRGTSGSIQLGPGASPLWNSPHIDWRVVDDIEAVQWGKLLINLNNAINALSGLTLLVQLQDRAWRRVMADQLVEALKVLKAAGIRPAKSTSAPPHFIPHILRLPTPLFPRIASQMLTIDPKARSSMWDDLNQGRLTEVDALQGAILDLAAQHKIAMPLMTKILDLIKSAEAAGAGSPGLSPLDLRPDQACRPGGSRYGRPDKEG